MSPVRPLYLSTLAFTSRAKGQYKSEPRRQSGARQTRRACRAMGRCALKTSSSCLQPNPLILTNFQHVSRNPTPKDVIKQLKSIVFYSDARLGMEERNLLSIAYKHITGTLRTSWRTVEGIEKVETANGRATLREQALIRRQREKIELELADACKDLLDLLDRHLVPAAEAGEERVFYLKMHVFPRLLPTLFPIPNILHAHFFLLGGVLLYTGRATIIGTLRNLRGMRSASRRRSWRWRLTRLRISTRLARCRRGIRRA
jgi:hypothetical protein